jgi:polyhydroxyalkanoate synthesis repressor PhaR
MGWITCPGGIVHCNSIPMDRIVIKKYGNRRMYDTVRSRYVNLEELAALIREGADVQVVDAKTGEDLTRVTLTQIIMEDAKDQPTGLPLELLRQLIVASDRARQDFMMWYLKSAFENYQKVQEAIQSQISGVREAAFAPLETMRRIFTPQALQSAENAELVQLRQRVAQLEDELRSKSNTSRRQGKSRRKAGNVTSKRRVGTN